METAAAVNKEPKPATPGDGPDGSVPGTWRLVSVLAYLGLGILPGLNRLRAWRPPELCHRHINRANVLLGLFFFMTVGFLLAGMIGGTAGSVPKGGFFRLIPDEWTLRVYFRRVTLAWLVFWSWGVLHAVRGRWGNMLGIDSLARRAVVAGICRGGLRIGAGCLAVMLGIGFHGIWMCRNAEASAKCYLLYESMEGRLPRVLFGFGFYSVIRAGSAVWGPGSVALLPLTVSNLAQALQRGEFVFVGSHGSESGLLLAEGTLSPEDVAGMRGEHVPRAVYLAGCNAAVKEWEQALHPARVLARDRQVGTAEHLAWIWCEGPAFIRDLAEPSAVSAGP